MLILEHLYLSDRLNAITTDICTAGGTAEYQALDVTKQGQPAIAGTRYGKDQMKLLDSEST